MPNINIPRVIQDAIAQGAIMAVSVSAGKDSQAMERALAGLRDQHRWENEFFAIHADIGQEFDWPWTLGLVERNARVLGHPLHVVRHEGETLLQTIWKRVEKTAGKVPPFPSHKCRFCTKAAKTEPCNKYYRRLGKGTLVINIMGLRADESRRRAKLPEVSVRKEITAKRLKKLEPDVALKLWAPGKERLALDWNPILPWSFEEVLDGCGGSMAEMMSRRDLLNLKCYDMAFAGWAASPTYVLGLNRHSCCLCLYTTPKEIPIVARLRHELIEAIAAMEEASGFTWKDKYPLSELNVKAEPIPGPAFTIQPLMAGYTAPAG